MKKLYLILIILIAVAALLLSRQIKVAKGIVTKFNPVPIVEPDAVYIPVNANDHQLGNPGAAIMVIEFVDLGCAKCQAVNFTISKFVREHPTSMRLVWKDAPQTSFFSAGNVLAHQAAYCAGKQSKFWPFAEAVMQDKYNLRENGLKKVAEGLKLNTEQWWKCVNSQEAKSKILDSMALAKSLGVKDLPAVFVNNKKINLMEDVSLEELLTRFLTKQE